jgi:hypothetical protein
MAARLERMEAMLAQMGANSKPGAK